MANTKNREPYSELIALCRTGHLFEVDEWYKSGKPTAPPTPYRRLTPICVAIEQGFHSLVEVLLRHGASPSGRPLQDAVFMGRADIVELLFQYGADVHSVEFVDAVLSHEPGIVRTFIEHGADLVTDYPMAEGLKYIRRPMLGTYKEYLQKIPDLKFQANVALRHACGEGKMRVVCLLLWLGADPRAKVPEHYDESEEFWNTPLREATYYGHLDVVKKIGVDPARDNLEELLRAACSSQDEEMIRYVMKFGTKPSSVDEYGESAFNELIWYLQWGVNRCFPGAGWDREHCAIRCIKTFVATGGKWNPDETSREIAHLRKCFYRMSPSTILELLAYFKDHEFCSDDTIIRVVNTQKLRDHLSSEPSLRALRRRIPFFNKWAKDR